MDMIEIFNNEIFLTLIFFVLVFISRAIIFKTINKAAIKWKRVHTRTTLIKKFINFFMVFIIILFLPLIWGFQPKDVTVFLSSIFAVIGIAFFAQWSILCNITSVIIMFFSFFFNILVFIILIYNDISIYCYFLVHR